MARGHITPSCKGTLVLLVRPAVEVVEAVLAKSVETPGYHDTWFVLCFETEAAGG